ncbi:hypothetical protein HK405_007972, partial [Cladochytrium tenue]
LKSTKVVSFFAGVCVLINSMTGATLPLTAATFQQAGWIIPIALFFVFAAISSFSVLFIIEAMQAIPGNKHFQGTVEFATLIDFYFGRWEHIVGQVLLYGAIQCQAIQSIVLVAQAFDNVLVETAHTTCGLGLTAGNASTIAWVCVHSTSPSGSPFLYGMIFTIGLLLVAAFCVPFGLSNLEDNVTMQMGAFFFTIFIVLQWVVSSILSGIQKHRVQPVVIQSGLANILGTIILNFSCTIFAPSLINMKQKEVQPQNVLWLTSLISIVLYTAVGVFPALGFDLCDSSNILPFLIGFGQPLILSKITAYMFSFVMLLPGIPVSFIVAEKNLTQGGLMPRWIAIILCHIVPFLCAIPLLTNADLFSQFVNWTGVLLTGPVNFIIPLVIYLKCLHFRRFYNRTRQVFSQPIPLRSSPSSGTPANVRDGPRDAETGSINSWSRRTPEPQAANEYLAVGPLDNQMPPRPRSQSSPAGMMAAAVPDFQSREPLSVVTAGSSAAVFSSSDSAGTSGATAAPVASSSVPLLNPALEPHSSEHADGSRGRGNPWSTTLLSGEQARSRSRTPDRRGGGSIAPQSFFASFGLSTTSSGRGDEEAGAPRPSMEGVEVEPVLIQAAEEEPWMNQPVPDPDAEDRELRAAQIADGTHERVTTRLSRNIQTIRRRITRLMGVHEEADELQPPTYPFELNPETGTLGPSQATEVAGQSNVALAERQGPSKSVGGAAPISTGDRPGGVGNSTSTDSPRPSDSTSGDLTGTGAVAGGQLRRQERLPRNQLGRSRTLPYNRQFRSSAFRSVPAWLPVRASTLAVGLLVVTSLLSLGDVIMAILSATGILGNGSGGSCPPNDTPVFNSTSVAAAVGAVASASLWTQIADAAAAAAVGLGAAGPLDKFAGDGGGGMTVGSADSFARLWDLVPGDNSGAQLPSLPTSPASVDWGYDG